MLTTAPINIPPALPPSIIRREGEVHFSPTGYLAQSTKSVKVFFFFIIRPSSCHCSPISITTADVRNGVCDPAIEQAQARTGKTHWRAEPIRSVCVKQHGAFPIFLEPLLINQRYGDFRAVARGRPLAFGNVGCLGS